MATSPSVANYYVGKGNVYMKTVDADNSTYAHIGNCPRFTLSTSHELLEHNFDTGGVVILDEVQIRSRSITVSIDAEEFTPENLATALGAYSAGGGVYRVAYAFVTRAVKFVGNNDKGQKVQVILPKVMFTVEGDIDLISDEYARMPLRGRCILHPKTAAGSDYTLADFTFL